MPFCSCLTPHRSAAVRFSGVGVMFDSRWPEATRGEEELGLVRACLFSAEEFLNHASTSASSSGWWSVHQMRGKMYICQKSFVTLGWSRALLPGDTAGMASLSPTVPRALRGAAKKLLAKECSHHLTFSLFQIFSWKQMTCMEGELPFQCHKTRTLLGDPKCRFVGTVLLLSNTESKYWPYNLEVTSSRWLFPLLTLKNAISCQSPILSIPFSENMKWSFLTAISYSALVRISPQWGTGDLGFTVTIRDQFLYTWSESATLVKLMRSRKKKKKREYWIISIVFIP